MSTPEDVKGRLQQLVNELEELTFPSSPISMDLVKYTVESLKDYLSDNAKSAQSLDAAFGITKKRGAPGDPQKRRDIARTVFDMQLKGKPWREIADEISLRGGDVTDERTLRRYLDEFTDELIAEVLCNRLNSGA